MKKPALSRKAGFHYTEGEVMNTFPAWRDEGNGFECDDDQQSMYAFACEFMCGFNLPKFDLWASSLPDCPGCGTTAECCLKQEMRERRKLAIESLSANNLDAAFRHLEWMLNRQREDMREQFLLPLARRDKKRQDGTTKERRPEINEWIKKMLRRAPGAKSPALWEGAPDWITDQIGYDRFSKRVTEVRKELNGRK